MKARNIKAVLFDFDGTLTEPGLIDFAAIKTEIKCPSDRPILEFIDDLPSAGDRQKALAVLERYEDASARAARPNAGAEEIVLFLRGEKKKLGIITRNRLKSLLTSMACFNKIGASDFDVIVTRENMLKLKPHPDGVLFAAKSLGISPSETAVVGDYVFDIEAGRRAGAATVFLESAHTKIRPDPPADFTIKALNGLRAICRAGWKRAED